MSTPPDWLSDTMHSALTARSSNSKTGPIAVSTTARPSCPATCPFAGDGGCYAEAGYYTRQHWDAVTDGTRGVPPEEFIAQVARLRPGSLFRHDVAGDLWHQAGRIHAALLRRLADATAHLGAAWTYTHHVRSVANLAAIRSISCRVPPAQSRFDPIATSTRRVPFFTHLLHQAMSMKSPHARTASRWEAALCAPALPENETATPLPRRSRRAIHP